jgi:hypothetical protein
MRRKNTRAISIASQQPDVQLTGVLGTLGMIATLMLVWWLTFVL